LLAEKEHLERECTDLVSTESENQEKIRGLEERIEGMEKEYESLEKRHLEVEPMVYAEEALEELRQENRNLDEAFAEERQRLEDLQQEYEKVVDELEELKESRDIDMLDTE
jgi:chromosome segregation ATPase